MAVGKRLENKVAMITGGASGIGAESAQLFAEHGAAVAIADINDNLGPKVVGEIESAGGSALYVHLDTALEEEWREAMALVKERFGRLDIMLNAAGVSGRLPDGSAAPRVGDANLENWNHVMAVNATGVFLGRSTPSSRCARRAAARSSTSRPSTASWARSTTRPTTLPRERSAPSPSRPPPSTRRRGSGSTRCTRASSIPR